MSTLWSREGYGTAAVDMIEDHPVVGVGVGSYSLLVRDVVMDSGNKADPDNAQNWYRQNLAEFGLLGSLGWIVFCAGFLGILWQGVRSRSQTFEAGTLSGPLVGLGVVSLVGTPGQDPTVAITFWTLAFWYLAATPVRGTARTEPSVLKFWLPALTVACACAFGTYAAGRGGLLPANRAVRVGWDYHYGLYGPEQEPNGTFRWTEKQAVAVIPVDGPVLKLTAWTNDPGATDQPVELKIWIDGRLEVDETLKTGERTERDLRVPVGQARAVLRTWVSRTWRPSDGQGSSDPRELGVALAGFKLVGETGGH
jgi:hypothetical protein